MKRPPESIRVYLAAFPAAVRARMNTVRREVLTLLPEAEERMSYGMPGFYVNGRGIIYIGAWKGHIALYPVPRSSDAFNAAVAKYRASKSAVHFPHDAALPVTLIRRIVRECVRAAAAKSRKAA